MNIEGGSDTSQSCIYIKDIVPGSACHCTGRLRVGDQLLDVNGNCMVGITNAQATKLLETASSPVTLVVARKKLEEDSYYSNTDEDEITDLATELANAVTMDGNDWDDGSDAASNGIRRDKLDVDEPDSVFMQSKTLAPISPQSPYSPGLGGSLSPQKAVFPKQSMDGDETDIANVVLRKQINSRAKRNFSAGE